MKVGDAEGTVIELGMFETRLRTGLGEEVLMPNAWVLGNTTRNYSRFHPGDGFMVDTTVTVGYDTPWRQVHAMLEQAALATPGVTPEPRPFVVQRALSDFYIEYRLTAYANLEDARERAAVRSHLHQHIVDVFEAHGVRLTSPHFMHVDANTLKRP